ncbi:G5 domain-containing protein [Aerococcus sp. HMSC10H05]|uniref:G5 domain-containing protein n=1 Tax=Aerococcus sp. HMSC10H05 TaxID=1581084 RepID=UPI0008A3E6B4|nr:G5 domain-containing protein [Aerococcus sp. HMSC10H05]OFU51436.1 hypothetical protein HMPREF3116_03920 [Aerococcus sp. HMSC10H05]
MDKQYRYVLRKTTLGLASVAIAAFIAGQTPTVYAAEIDSPSQNSGLEIPEEKPIEAQQSDSADNVFAAESDSSSQNSGLEIPEEKPIEAQQSDSADNVFAAESDSSSQNSGHEILEEKPVEAQQSDSTDNALLADQIVEPAEPVEEKPQKGQAVAYGVEVPVADTTATQNSNEENYSVDEGKIKDYSESERYKQTDLERGDTNQYNLITDQGEVKDGLEFNTANPSETSPSKTEYGYQITIDKKTGQRTYTRIDVTDSGLIPVNPGNKSMMGQGEGLTSDTPKVTYKPNENTEVTKGGRQTNLGYGASEETLKHINNKDNNSTSFGFKDKYTQNNPNTKFFGDNFAITYKVNPWPNENDKLEELKLNKNNYDSTQKYFVQGQDIDTFIKVDNIDESAKERLVGQVYNPVTGKIVPGASAYIGDNGNIYVKLPVGALKKDENGKTIINEDSIFNQQEYKGLQNLDVKFFARPRTADEFKAIAGAAENEWESGTYVETGAGTAEINHKGKSVTIDKQGIDRYDHYNLIGDFKLNLDDTRYYDQRFVDGNGDDTTKVTSSAVKPGEEFKVGIVEPENPGETDKSAEEMNAAESNGEASGRLIMDFIDRENKGKAPEDQWKIELKDGDISNFTVTPPKSAKAGDFMAIPIEYTYTNGSKDIHWFHFVVQESDYIKPEYETQVNYLAKEQTSPATVTEDGKRIPPSSYTLPGTLETDESGNQLVTDDSGNKWTVKLNEKTGQVTAKPVDPTAFNGGEKLTVPVIAHYVDEQKPGEDIIEEVNAYFVIEEKTNMTPRYNAKVGQEGDKLSSDVILNTEDNYNRRPGKYTLDSDTYTDDKGNVWNVSIDETTGKVTATVPNAEEGKTVDGALLNVPVTAHYYEEDGKLEVGTKRTEVQFMAYGTNGTVEKILEIPFETRVEKDSKLKKGEIKVITEGEKGSKKVTYIIEDSIIIDTKEEKLTEPKERLIYVGEGTNDGTHTIEEKVEVPFEVEVQFDDSLKPGEQKVAQEGVPGEKTRTTTLTIQDGEVVDTTTADFKTTTEPVKKIIKVGRNTEGTHIYEEKIPFKYDISYDKNLKSGEYVIDVEGTEGTKKTTWTIKNSEIVGEAKVETTNPINAVIRVGQKDFTGEFSHEVKEEIPFTVRVIEDETLEAGKSEVVTQGQPGTKTTKYTQTIKNGQADGELKSEETTKTEPVEHVIRVGKRPATNYIEENSSVPVDIMYKYDPDMEVTTARKGDLIPGEVKTVVTNKYNPETGEIESVKKTVVTNAKQEIIIGVKQYTGEFEYEYNQQIPYETKIIFDDTLASGTIKVDQPGKLGNIKNEVIAKFENGNQVSNEEKVLERTEPEKRIVRVGSKTDGTHQHKEEIPFKYTVIYDPEMPAGTYEEVTPGKNGERVTIWTINNSKIVGVPTTIETKPVDAIIKVGSKDFTGEFETTNTKPIEFETEYIVDNSMEPGTTKVEQEGSLGEVETKVTHTIVNGQVIESTEGATYQKKAPVKRIVKVGPAKTDGTHEYTNTIPFEVEVRINPELKKGEHKVVQKGETGEEKYTITIENSKVTETSEVAMTKSPVKEIIEVGSQDFTGEINYVDKDPIPYETEVTVDPSLKPGEIVEDQKGELGEQETKVSRTITNGEASEEVRGETTRTKEPVNRKIRVGSKTDGTHTYTNKKPFEVEVRVNPELKKGEHKIVQKGVEGEEEYTITIENSKVTNTSEPKETKAPVKEIIEVGNADFTGNVEYVDKDSIPYETEVTVDPSLKPGEIVEDQKGELGEQETKVSRTITNGEASEEVRGETTRTKEPVNRKIRVGSKTDGQYKETETIPFEIEVRKDPSLAKGEWKYAEVDGVQQTGESGLKERTLTIVNSKVTEESEFKTTREPKKAIILVGEDSSTGEVTHTEELPFGYKVEEVDDLQKGEYRIVKPGKVGTKTTTWTIKDSKVDGDPKEEIVQAEDALIQVGKGTSEGTHEIKEKKELSFETRVEYDDNLEAGQREETGGEPGEQERTNTLVIKDGKVIETKEGEFNTIKDPVEKVIKIGTKPIVKVVEKQFETEYIYDENVEMGKEEVTPGENGKVTITTSYDKDQGKLVTKEETNDPVKRVVKVGVKPVVKEEPIPNNTEYKHNPELKAGEVRKIQDGTPGKAIITTSFNKATGKFETKVERTEPTDAVYEYGSKTDGKVTVENEVPFEVEIIEDPEMEAGKSETVQEGKIGKKETIITIENSKEVSRKENIIEESVKKIVKIGTKCKCEIPPLNPEEPGTPGEENPKDPEMPGEEDLKDPETSGEEDPKDPETPGEEDPKDPETPGEEDPKDPENPTKPGADQPGSNNLTEKSDTPITDSATHVDKAGALPETGQKMENHTFGAAVLSILSGLGLVTTKRRKEEE